MLVLAGCSTVPDPGDSQIESARNYIKEVTGDDLKASGLFVTVRTAVADGRKVRINGTIVNRYEVPVEGVRYRVEFVSAGDIPQVIDTFYEEYADTVLDAGEDHTMRLEIENVRRATGPGRFAIEAHPMRLGGKDVPPPSRWE